MSLESLRKKLKIDKYPTCAVFASRYESVLDPLPRVERPEGVALLIAFVYTLEEMQELVARVHPHAEVQALHLAYPKKGNKLSIPHIGRDDIFPALGVNIDTGIVEGTDLRFNMMVSLDENFTIVGMRREQLSAKVKTERKCSSDYQAQIPVLEAMLSPEERARFAQLAPSYQREWTAHILSAKTEATRTRRLAQLSEALRLGYKTLDQLRKHK